MDAERFGALTRRVGAAATRRAALAALVTGVLGGAVLTSDEAEAGIPIVNCKIPGKGCRKNQSCCSGRCRKGRCKCSAKGRPCWDPLEGALCCSGRCQNGTCQ